jgi:NAD(P)-dependent dehydrogenase (short-subunit alcohol dehydrogenase family)
MVFGRRFSPFCEHELVLQVAFHGSTRRDVSLVTEFGPISFGAFSGLYPQQRLVRVSITKAKIHIIFMITLEGQKVVVTGGSRGLGHGIVEALVAQKAQVTVVARDPERLAEVSKRFGVDVVRGDVTDEKLARDVLSNVRPSVLVLNAGTTPTMGPLHKFTWETFNRTWDVDVKAGFHWIQETLRLPLAHGSRVIITSSGAAQNGSPLSGSYAGAKRMLWLMALYANEEAEELGLNIHFQVIVPQQIIGDTDLGRMAAEAYASSNGISPEAFLARFGAPMPPRKVGGHVTTILTDPSYAQGVAFGLSGERGIVPLDDR